MVQARPSSPPSACLGVLPSASDFSFPLPFQGSPAPGKVCWCWCFLLVPPLLFCVPRLVFLLSSFHPIFSLISLSFPCYPHLHLTAGTSVFDPAWRGVCVEHLNRCKTSSWSHPKQGDWSRFAYPVQRSYGISVDEWSDQPLVPAFLSVMARGQAKNRLTDISFFMHGCRNLFIWFCNFGPFQNAELWMHYFILGFISTFLRTSCISCGVRRRAHLDI